MASGICSMGVDVLLVGPMPTPGIAFLTRSLRADAGAVISASHNPFQDNGIKFFARDGFKLPDEVELEIERLVLDERRSTRLRPTADRDRQGVPHRRRARPLQRVREEHASRAHLTLDGLTVVVDCAQRRRLPGRARGARRARRDGHRARRASPTARTSTSDCGALHPERARSARCASRGATSASRSTATPTAASSSTRAARWSTATGAGDGGGGELRHG